MLIVLIGILLTKKYIDTDGYTTNILHIGKAFISRLILCGVPFLAIYNVYSAVLRAWGIASPVFVSTGCSVINAVLDILMVVVFRYGLSGAAIAQYFLK